MSAIGPPCPEPMRCPSRRRLSARPRRLRAAASLTIGLLVMTLLVGGPVGVAATAQDQRADPPRIRSIEFSGNEQVPSGELRGAMHLRQRSWWKPFQRNYFYGTDHLEPDLERVLALYRGEGHVFAQLEGATVRYLSPEWVTIRIELDEGPRIYTNGTRVEGTTEPLPARLQKELEEEIAVRPGDPLREQRLRKDEEGLLRVCGQAGHVLAEVTREMRFQADSAEVIYYVAPRPRVRIGQIRIEGQERTRRNVIAREVRLKPGQTFRLSRAWDTQDRLFELGLFRSVRIRPIFPDTSQWGPGSESVTVDLMVRVAEKAAGWYGFGFGYSSADRLRLLGEWGYRNIGGRARALRLLGEMRYQFEQSGVEEAWEPNVEVAYTEPWIFGSPIRGQVSAYYRFLREPSLDEDIVGVALQASFRPGRFKRLIAELENERTWVTRSADPDVPSSYDTRLLSLSYLIDSRDFILDPHRGSFVQLVGEYAGGFLGGVATFTRWTASYTSYIPLGRRLTWAYRLRGGYMVPINMTVSEAATLPALLDERFRAGGGTTVRGYREESLGPYSEEDPDQNLGGLALILLNGELRMALFGRLGAVVFVDAGNVWSDYRQIKLSAFGHAWQREDYSELDVAYSVGTGLRFRTPVGPLRLDYGLKVGRDHRSAGRGEWHLSLGQAF